MPASERGDRVDELGAPNESADELEAAPEADAVEPSPSEAGGLPSWGTAGPPPGPSGGGQEQEPESPLERHRRRLLRERRGEYSTVPGLPELIEFFVQVGPYVGAAAVGGIIGNRADAGTVAVATRMFRSVRDRWQRRRVTDTEPLSRDEAVEAATAAAIAQGYSPDGIRCASAVRDQLGTWVVVLLACFDEFEGLPFPPRERLHVRVPPGDPAQATIVIVPLTGQ